MSLMVSGIAILIRYRLMPKSYFMGGFRCFK